MLWWIIGGVAIALVVAAVLFIRWGKAAGTLTSIVLMRSGPLHLTEAHVLAAAKRIFKDDAPVAGLPLGGTRPPGLLAGFAILLSGAPVFDVISADRPYGEAADANNIREAKARRVFKSHKVWVSVDVVGGAPPAKMRSMVMMSPGRRGRRPDGQGNRSALLEVARPNRLPVGHEEGWRVRERRRDLHRPTYFASPLCI